MAAVETAIPHLCSKYIPCGCSAERCTPLLSKLHSIWLQCWPLYLTSLWTTFRMAEVLTAVPHFFRYYIPYGCSADRCNSLLYELHSVWLKCWPLYLTYVLTTLHLAAVLTAVPHFFMYYIPYGCSADRCTSLLYELHSVWLKCWPLYLTSVWTTFCMAEVLAAVPHLCINYIAFGCSVDSCTSLLYVLQSIWLQCWPLYLTSVCTNSIWLQCWPLYLTSIWTTFRMAEVLTAVPHFCMYYIPYGCIAGRCTSLLY